MQCRAGVAGPLSAPRILRGVRVGIRVMNRVRGQLGSRDRVRGRCFDVGLELELELELG